MRLSVSLLARLLAIATFTSVNAGGLCGQNPTYAVGHAPNGYAVGYSPGAASTYVPGPAYVSGYAPSVSTYVDPSSIAPLSNNGAYQAQRPAYFDNPSVYTGLPVSGGVPDTGYQAAYQSFSAPLTDSLRGNGAPAAFVESYPSMYSSAYDGSIPGQPMTVATPAGVPATAMAVTPVTPIFTPAAPSKGCCLSRFCSKLFGTSYSTSFYRAPITFYRPVTSMDPMTGAAMVVQQPCTSFVQQVQRTPYSALQFGQTSAAPTPAACPTPCPANQPCYGPNTYSYGAPTASTPNSYDQYGSIGQAGALSGTGEVTNIPSTAPLSPTSIQPSYFPAQQGTVPNTAPLTGVPTMAPPQGGGDLAPVGQPTLESGMSPSVPPSSTVPPPSQASPPYWQLQSPEDSTALIRPKSSEPRATETNSTPLSPPQRIIDNENFTRAEPIEAPSDYVAPYRPQGFQSPRTTPVTMQNDGTIGQPSANGTCNASDLTSVSARMPSAVSPLTSRSQSPVIRQPLQKPRDSTWIPVRQ